MFSDNIWENILTIVMGAILFFCGTKEGERRARTATRETENQKRIQELEKQIADLKRQ